MDHSRADTDLKKSLLKLKAESFKKTTRTLSFLKSECLTGWEIPDHIHHDNSETDKQMFLDFDPSTSMYRNQQMSMHTKSKESTVCTVQTPTTTPEAATAKITTPKTTPKLTPSKQRSSQETSNMSQITKSKATPVSHSKSINRVQRVYDPDNTEKKIRSVRGRRTTRITSQIDNSESTKNGNEISGKMLFNRSLSAETFSKVAPRKRQHTSRFFQQKNTKTIQGIGKTVTKDGANGNADSGLDSGNMKTTPQNQTHPSILMNSAPTPGTNNLLSRHMEGVSANNADDNGHADNLEKPNDANLPADISHVKCDNKVGWVSLGEVVTFRAEDVAAEGCHPESPDPSEMIFRRGCYHSAQFVLGIKPEDDGNHKGGAPKREEIGEKRPTETSMQVVAAADATDTTLRPTGINKDVKKKWIGGGVSQKNAGFDGSEGIPLIKGTALSEDSSTNLSKRLATICEENETTVKEHTCLYESQRSSTFIKNVIESENDGKVKEESQKQNEKTRCPTSKSADFESPEKAQTSTPIAPRKESPPNATTVIDTKPRSTPIEMLVIKDEPQPNKLLNKDQQNASPKHTSTGNKNIGSYRRIYRKLVHKKKEKPALPSNISKKPHNLDEKESNQTNQERDKNPQMVKNKVLEPGAQINNTKTREQQSRANTSPENKDITDDAEITKQRDVPKAGRYSPKHIIQNSFKIMSTSGENDTKGRNHGAINVQPNSYANSKKGDQKLSSIRNDTAKKSTFTHTKRERYIDDQDIKINGSPTKCEGVGYLALSKKQSQSKSTQPLGQNQKPSIADSDVLRSHYRRRDDDETRIENQDERQVLSYISQVISARLEEKSSEKGAESEKDSQLKGEDIDGETDRVCRQIRQGCEVSKSGYASMSKVAKLEYDSKAFTGVGLPVSDCDGFGLQCANNDKRSLSPISFETFHDIVYGAGDDDDSSESSDEYTKGILGKGEFGPDFDGGNRRNGGDGRRRRRGRGGPGHGDGMNSKEAKSFYNDGHKDSVSDVKSRGRHTASGDDSCESVGGCGFGGRGGIGEDVQKKGSKLVQDGSHRNGGVGGGRRRRENQNKKFFRSVNDDGQQFDTVSFGGADDGGAGVGGRVSCHMDGVNKKEHKYFDDDCHRISNVGRHQGKNQHKKEPGYHLHTDNHCYGDRVGNGEYPNKKKPKTLTRNRENPRRLDEYFGTDENKTSSEYSDDMGNDNDDVDGANRCIQDYHTNDDDFENLEDGYGTAGLVTNEMLQNHSTPLHAQNYHNICGNIRPMEDRIDDDVMLDNGNEQTFEELDNVLTSLYSQVTISALRVEEVREAMNEVGILQKKSKLLRDRINFRAAQRGATLDDRDASSKRNNKVVGNQWDGTLGDVLLLFGFMVVQICIHLFITKIWGIE